MDRFLPMAEAAEDQQYATFILYLHTATKGTQVGSVLGLLLGGLGSMWRRTPFIKTAMRVSSYGLLAGPVASMALTAARMKGRAEVEYQDRAWRLQRHRGQQTIDALSTVGLVTGAVAGSLLKLGGLSGASVGTVCGVAVYGVYKAGKRS